MSEPDVLTPVIPQDLGYRSQRQRILTAMAASCAEKGFPATTIADIVSHAGISRATFYKHFENKQECFNVTAANFVDELRDAAREALPAEGLPVEALRSMTLAVLERLAAKPACASLLVLEAPTVDPEFIRDGRGAILRSLESRFGENSQGTPGANPELAFGRATLLVAGYIAAGKTEQLPSLLPEIVYISLVPYLGQEAALAQAGIKR